MRREAHRLASAGAHAVAILPMKVGGLQGWFESAGSGLRSGARSRIRLAGDPTREIFRRYGVGRLSWGRLVTRRTLRETSRARREAELPARWGGDHFGQPALFVIDGKQQVRLAHLASDMADRPGWEQVWSALEAGSQESKGKESL